MLKAKEKNGTLYILNHHGHSYICDVPENKRNVSKKDLI